MKYSCLLCITFLFTNCSKDPIPLVNCENLKAGLLNDDVSVVGNSLGSLLNETYSQQNLNQLADTIKYSCNIVSQLSCYNCIFTAPPQSEIYFALLDDHGDSTARVLDVTQTSDNKIKLLSVHE